MELNLISSITEIFISEQTNSLRLEKVKKSSISHKEQAENVNFYDEILTNSQVIISCILSLFSC